MPMGNKKPKGSTKAPLAKGGWFCLWQNRGDTQALPGYFFPNHSSLFTKKPSPFHMGLYLFVLWESANCESLSHAYGVPAPFSKGALRAVPAANTHDSFQQIVTAPPMPGNVTGWKSRHRAKAPLAKGGCLGLPRRGDSPGKAWELLTYYLFTIH